MNDRIRGRDGRFVPLGLLKRDQFGAVLRGLWLDRSGSEFAVAARDLRAASPLLRLPARLLARREARILARLSGMPGVPRLVHWRPPLLVRSWLPGVPLDAAQGAGRRWFDEAAALLAALHARGITHNDLHKEANWLVTPTGGAALVDFQLAWAHRARGRWFALCAREDRRHLLKHKRRYLEPALTREERALLASPSFIARSWRLSGKRLYLFVSRRILGWRDREGRGSPERRTQDSRPRR